MALADTYKVAPITRRQAMIIVLNNHYSMSMPNAIISYGLMAKNKKLNPVEGVCVFGTPPSTGFNATPWKTFELQRLVILNNTKNLASYLISQALSKLKKPKLIVSYADQNMNHCGYIYQATNWLYTGEGGDSSIYSLNGKKIHTKNINDVIYRSRSNEWKKNKKTQYNISKWELITRLFPGITKQKLKPKHRYFYVLAESKKQKKEMIKWVEKQFGIYPYPKSVNKLYSMDKIKKQNNNKYEGGFF